MLILNQSFFKNLIDKYRPIKWNEVVGQTDITITLKKAIQENRLSQFLFFFGPKGVGKNTCARILANELNSFSKFEIIQNIFEINGNFNNSLEYIYNITNKSIFLSKKGKYNILIIREIHMFSKNFFNFFLKFIEEKHPHILFIFCETEEKKIPELILLRCKVYEFKRISIKEIFFHLKMIAEKENIEIENEALFVLSKYAEGSIGKAIYIFDKLNNYDINGKKISKEFIMKKLGIIDVKYYFKIIDHLLNEKMHKIFILLDKIYQYEIDSYNFIIGLIKHFKNLFLSKNTETISILKFEKKIIESYIEQSKKISYLLLINALNICISLEKEYKLNSNSKLTIEIYLIQLVHFFYFKKNHYNKLKLVENNQEFLFYAKNEKIHFLHKNWINFIQKFSDKINTIYLDFLKNEIQFKIIKNKIFFMIPYRLVNSDFLLIQTHFIKYFKKKLNNPYLEFKIIKIKSKGTPIEQYNFLYKKNKLVETLIERLNLKISYSARQEEKKSL
ncbi:AAA family ATPase [Blattabacterium cuenoti]|uniref:AAA family ATPase n=1 Tax=Blattabacterium cuenoti TaxID=1653831 RepID=UPI001EEB1E69|nr:AAA family ATPase [Blattabacterium cuenoti]